jgi:hypothetical protein
MWTDPIVAEVHAIRADIVARAGDNSHDITLEAKRLTQEIAEKFGMRWQRASPVPVKTVVA